MGALLLSAMHCWLFSSYCRWQHWTIYRPTVM